MTPKRAGAAVIAASVVVGIGAGAFLTTSGWWSLVAAAVLSACIAGLGLGTIWTTRTTWGPEPASVERDAAALTRSSRRTAVATGVGAVVLSLAALSTAAVAAVLGRLGPSAVSVAIASAVGIAIGVMLVRFGRSNAVADTDAEPAVGAETAGEPGWRRVTRRDPAAIILYSGPVVALVAWLLFQVVRLPGELAGGRVIGFVVSAAVAVGVLVGGAMWASRRYPEVWIDDERRLIRARDREIAWSDIVSAQVSTLRVWPGAPRTVFLTLATTDGLRVPLPVRRRDKLAMTAAERELVERAVAGSSVAMPRAPEDPDGRFARFNFPTHVGRQDAARLVAHPPRADEDLPITGG